MEIYLKEESYRIIGACMEVHRELGCGFNEKVYQEALEIELSERKIPFEREVELLIFYKGYELNKRFVADYLCYGSIILELKALNQLANEHISQVLNYLKASDLKLGILINFGTTSLNYQRVLI